MSTYFSFKRVSDVIFLPEVQVYTLLSLQQSPAKTSRNFTKSSREKPYNCAIRFFSLAANLYYFVIQCIDVPGYFCSFSLLIRLAKLFSLLGHRVRVIMFIDIALWLSYCFHLSARRNVVSVQIRSNQFLLAPLSKFMLHCTYHS